MIFSYFCSDTIVFHISGQTASSLLILIGAIMKLYDLIGIVAPPLCGACGTPLVSGEECLCALCEATLERSCIVEDECGPLRRRVACRTAPVRHMAAWTTYSHDSPVGRLIRRGKYNDSPVIFSALGRILGRRLLDSGQFSDLDVLLPVPMHWFKRLRRGYNQAGILSREIGHILGVPVGDNLRAARPHRTQTHRSGDSRREALRGRFCLIAPDELRGLHVALVDDIITTGGTATAAVDTLMQAAPASISVIALAATAQD